MRNKKLIVFICVLAFLTVLIVLNSTVFTLQKININWMTTKHKLERVSDEKISENIDVGGSIFLLNKTNITNKLEKENPYLRVVGIETQFPNKIVVHSAERETLYAVEISQNEYAVVDELGKVLEITNSTIFAGSALGTKPIKVTFNNSTLDISKFAVGEEIKDESIKNLLTKLSKTLREANYDPTSSKGIFINIDVLLMGTGYEVNMNTRNGMSIKIEDVYKYTTDKFLLGLQAYNIKHQDSVVEGTIVVTYNQQLNKCIARYENN